LCVSCLFSVLERTFRSTSHVEASFGTNLESPRLYIWRDASSHAHPSAQPVLEFNACSAIA